MAQFGKKGNDMTFGGHLVPLAAFALERSE